MGIPMFLNNKYTNWYNLLIESRKNRICNNSEYYETHHILPKCMGGANTLDNLVKLTAREHYIAHLLLTEMCMHETHQRKMKYALQRMMGNSSNWSNGQYEIARKKNRNALIGKIFTDDHKQKLSISNTGVKRSNETKSKLSENAKLRIGNKNPFYLKTHSDNTKNNLSKKAKNRIWITNGIESKVIYSSTPIPQGWRRGRIKPY